MEDINVKSEQFNEEKLAFLASIIESSDDAIIGKTLDGTILSWNMGAQKIYGYSANEVTGHSISILVPPGYPDDISQILKRIRQGQRIEHYETVRMRKDGKKIDISLTISPIKDSTGRIIGASTIARDITERKRAEEALRRAYDDLEMRVQERTSELSRTNEALRRERDKAQKYLDVAGVMVVIIGADQKVVLVNRKCCEILRYNEHEIIGKNWFETFLPERVRYEVEVVFTKLMAGEIEPVEFFENPVLTRSGKERMIAWHNTVLRDEAGNITSILSSGEDITERKRAEEERERWTAELARSNAELEQFAYVASHDLQEPLRMISGFTKLLERRYKGRLDRSADEFIAYIVDGAARMQRMIEDLLAYSRVGTRGKPFEPTNFEDIFDQAVANLMITIEENKAQVTHDPLPTVMADDSQVAQLLQNLISNGIKFRREEPPRVHVSARRKGNEWFFSVQDNGIGIAPEFFGSLFQLFQREHAANKYPGTGIGLAICRRIVERHGGRIWAESEVGKGSKFYFTIPVKK
ncbi:PAS domain S-box [Candidatus Methanoperedens nitroreducens]|uniref:histidine kinase n=2 Tax=Candidatus Methanoperedens nitratireducens TaxID=1392998 RepID=A0A062UZQ9_9EURY|nr:PAS domain S-box [Candidatus Methanoperedens nitroreducens]MDJ1420510.1 PAS domain S-box protein [Candidatus Methanoperedens sp.]